MHVIARSLLALLLLLSAAGNGFAQASAADKNQAARRAMEAGRFDEAAGLYRSLLEGLPDEPGLLMNLGMALAMGGHDADAIAPLERAVAAKPALMPASLFLGSSYLAVGRSSEAVAPLKRVAAAKPSDVESRRLLAQAYADTGRVDDAVAALRDVTRIAPAAPEGWYALGHAYNALTQDAMATFSTEPDDSPWRQLLVADALLADGRLIDSFALQRAALERLPSMVSIHDSIARIYELSKHADWAAAERAKGGLTPAACVRRRALCEFRTGRFIQALNAAMAGSEVESQYWKVRTATELALASFKQLDQLPDSRERREVHATLAIGQRRYTDAIAELKAALGFAKDDPNLLDDLATAYYSSHDYEQAAATLRPLVAANPDDPRLLTLLGDSLLQLQQPEAAIPFLQRAVSRDPADPMPSLSLGRAYVLKGDFAAAIPLLEARLAGDTDGSLHVQLARAYSGTGQKDKAQALLERSQALQRAAQERAAAGADRSIEAPK